MANARLGTHETKVRSEVAGGGAKPWKQKGTGRARAGTSRSPLWRGGGITFGPKPRNYEFSLQKKVRSNALRQVLSTKAGSEKFIVVDDFAFDAPRTKDFIKSLNSFKLTGKVLVVDADNENDNLYLSLRNLPGVNVLPCEGLNVYDVMNHETVLCTQKGLRAIEARLA
jgi:large subunit ribosomal protein L4